MKKLMLLAILLLPCVPSLVLGVIDQKEFNERKREELLTERFETWCRNNGFNLAVISKEQADVIWDDVWSETDDYESALDSVDAVMSFVNQLKADM